MREGVQELGKEGRREGVSKGVKMFHFMKKERTEEEKLEKERKKKEKRERKENKEKKKVNRYLLYGRYAI